MISSEKGDSVRPPKQRRADKKTLVILNDGKVRNSVMQEDKYYIRF